MRVIIIDDNNAILVKGWWFLKKQAEVYKVYEYMGKQGWKYTHTGQWVIMECHKAIMKAYKFTEPEPARYTDGNPWIPAPKKLPEAKKTKLPTAKLLTPDRK